MKRRPQRQHNKWLHDWWVATNEVERATIAFSEELQIVEEALNGENAKKWEIIMQEEYESLVINNT
jgi:hypothetical protein